MLLYHFTSEAALRQIREGGLSRGAVTTSPATTLNAVWLTTNPGPDGHGLESGGAVMTEAQREQAWEWSGVWPPPGARLPKEASVRITVDLDPTDRDLHEWLAWARRNVSPETFAELHPVASPIHRKAKSWRLYFGVIPASDFVAVDIAAQPMPATPAGRAA